MPIAMGKRLISYVRSSNIFTDSRATKEIQTLLDAGYKILVIGWDKKGDALDQCQELFGSRDIEFCFFDIKIEHQIGANKIRGMGYLLSYFRFVYRTLVAYKNDIIAVHACDLDSGVGADKFCKQYKKKLVYDIYDYYIDSHSVPKVLRTLVENLEISVINRADATIICTKERLQQIIKARPKRVVVLHNAPRLSDITVSEKEKYDFAYCGAMIDCRLIKEILDEYEKNHDKKVLFAGSGIYAELCECIARNRENFQYVGPIVYERVLHYEAQAKVISAIYEPSRRNHRLCAPNKFYEAMALGKPIIVCRGTGIDKIVEKENIGVVINYNATEFYQALQYLCDHPEVRLHMGERAHEIFSENYKWEIMDKRLKQLYGEIL